MTNQHPITPPPELVNKWHQEYLDLYSSGDSISRSIYVATQAAQWGADQELEACCADVHTTWGKGKAEWLRSMRRAKPPSLKEQALEALEALPTPAGQVTADRFDTIRRALEALDD